METKILVDRDVILSYPSFSGYFMIRTYVIKIQPRGGGGGLYNLESHLLLFTQVNPWTNKL